MDNVGLVVSDLSAAVAFFTELGLELEGETSVEGPWVDGTVGLTDVRCDIAMMRTPDGHTRLEIAQYANPPATGGEADVPANTLGIRRLMFLVDDLDGTMRRLAPLGAELVGTVQEFENIYRLCYFRGPDGIMLALAQELG